MMKPDWRCLLSFHSWEYYSCKAIKGTVRVRACRRCHMSQNYISNHRYAGWRTIDEGELGEWKEYQERQKYNKLSPELQEAFLEMVRRKEREKRPPSN